MALLKDKAGNEI